MISYNNKNSQTKRVVILFFLALIILGSLIFKDYGMSNDEWRERVTGTVTANYLTEKFIPSMSKEDIPALETYKDRDYGVAFSLPAVILEYAFGLKSDRNVFHFRHYLTFLMFMIGVFAVYQMASRRFSNRWIGLLAATFMLLSPRIFADSFYNSKDIVFMAAYALAINTAIMYMLTPSIKNAIIHAFVTAYAIDIRVMAVVVPAATILILFIRLFRREIYLKKMIITLATYLVLSGVLVVIMWPWLWTDPLGNFIQAFENMSKFRWHGSELYFGELIKATNLPWHYTFTWIGITTPIIYLVLFIVGSLYILFQLISNHIKLWKSDEQLQDYLFFGFFWIPILAVIILQSVLYNGWRQLYFVYPMFILIATGGLILLWKNSTLIYKKFLVGFISIYLTYTVLWMWNVHPMQNVYFNVLAGKEWKTKWSMDYWGLGNLQAVEYILDNDNSHKVNIKVISRTNLFLFFLLKNPDDRSRINYVKTLEEADYVLNNYYRHHYDPIYKDEDLLKNFSVYYQIKDGSEEILTVLKRK